MAGQIVTGWKLISAAERDDLDERDIETQFKLLCILLRDKAYEGLINCILEMSRGIIIVIDVDISPEKRWNTIKQLTKHFTIYILQFSTKIQESISMAWNQEEIGYGGRVQNEIFAEEERRVQIVASSEIEFIKAFFPSATPRYHIPQPESVSTSIVRKAVPGGKPNLTIVEHLPKVREFYLREMIYLSHASNPKTVRKEIDDCGGVDNYINAKIEEWIDKYEKIKKDISKYDSDDDDSDDNRKESIMKNNLLLAPGTFRFSDNGFKDYQYHAFNRLKKLLREIEN